MITCEGGRLGVLDSPLEAELEAIAKGVSMVHRRGEPRVLFLSDCKKAITVIKREESLENRSGYTLEEIQRVLRKHKNWTFGYIPRDYNCAVHCLA